MYFRAFGGGVPRSPKSVASNLRILTTKIEPTDSGVDAGPRLVADNGPDLIRRDRARSERAQATQGRERRRTAGAKTATEHRPRREPCGAVRLLVGALV